MDLISMLDFYHISFLLIFLSCSQYSENTHSADAELSNTEDVSSTNHRKYNFQQPDAVFILASELKEISGLSFLSTKNILITHNDESGVFYEVDKSNGKILKEQLFNEAGDFEGIENVNDKIIITKNNGTLYFFDEESKKTEIIKTKLSTKNDVEGLGYYKSKNLLLLACKGQSLKEKRTKKEKCIYAFDLKTKTLIPDPFHTIKDKKLKVWVENNYSADSKKDLKKKIAKVQNFSPSGIAVSNNEKEIYIISAKGSILLIYKNEKESVDGMRQTRLDLRAIHFLNSKTIPQPEGICFDKENNLYISTEGQGFSGKIFKFNYHG